VTGNCKSRRTTVSNATWHELKNENGSQNNCTLRNIIICRYCVRASSYLGCSDVHKAHMIYNLWQCLINPHDNLQLAAVNRRTRSAVSAIHCFRVRGRLHVYKSEYESPYDSVQDLDWQVLTLKLQSPLFRKLYTESYSNSYAKSHVSWSDQLFSFIEAFFDISRRQAE
jgi:hypothetical protein